MSEALRQHLERYIVFDHSDFERIAGHFTRVETAKKSNLLQEGRVCKAQYFVIKGCLRMFFVNEKGVEQTIQFALENWWISDYTSFTAQKASEMNIQSVEKSEILALTFIDQEKLFREFPVMESYFRIMHQRAHAAFQTRIKIIYSLSREEMYHKFSQLYPEFVQRIPQYMLASFLGFSPEYLSEIRRKRIS